MDLAIDEVTTISQIIQDAAGEEAEIIFGAVHDPEMKEEVRVTVIATGFDRADEKPGGVIRPNFGRKPAPYSQPQPQVLQARAVGAVNQDVSAGPAGSSVTVEHSATIRPIDMRTPTDLRIPTFIRRQMD
jgi:cell division protein FtsZ